MRFRPYSFVLVVAAAGCGGGGGHSSSSSSTSFKFSPNSIVYGVANSADGNFALDQLAPTGGTPKTLAADVDGSIGAFAALPDNSGRYVIAANQEAQGAYNLYLAKGLSTQNATSLFIYPFTLATISSLIVTPDGRNIVFATEGSLYTTSITTPNYSPVFLGAADAAALSPADGDTIAYVASDGNEGPDAVFTRSLAAGTDATVTTIVSDGQNHALPAFSRDGGKLAYWTLVDGANALSVRTMATGATVTIPGVAGIEPQGTAFGPDGTTLAIVGQSLVAGNSGVAGIIATAPADGSAPPTTLFSESSLLGDYGFFWTDAKGRALSMNRTGSASSRHRKTTAKRL